ncbi:MAG: hypothetical protein J0H15_10595 [Xanthomonadales bacterium]|nr:hypothetical protein [Xanthomonadales bacterium]
MNRDKTIAAVGVSEEEEAHLRLLVRRCSAELDRRWTWADGENADLLVVDPGSFAGQMARTRALAGGARVAVFSDEDIEGAGLVLRRPLLRANVVELLNQVTRETVDAPAIGANTGDFYLRDLGEADAAGPAATTESPAAGLDDLLRPLPDELRAAQHRPAASGSPAPAFPTGAPVSEPGRSPSAAAPPPRGASLADAEPHRLRDWLGEGLLNAPARIALPGAPALVLDPKHRTAYAQAGLAALRPWCEAKWAARDWRPLTTSELAAIRSDHAAFAYERLVWLDVLHHSGGQLARRLDPGGTYRLTRWMEIDHDLGQHFRIASQMMKPLRLHEIAAASGAPMADVFDVVNAYDAIGLLEWQPRQRGGGESGGSLLQRLRRGLKDVGRS